MLIAMGERPAILSRGYARKIFEEGVVVVSDGTRVLEPVERSGDEPQMLARAVPQAAVLVSSSRYLAGRIAESRFGCTVHVLDDGFQHFDLMRDIDLLVAPDTSNDTRTLPFGRFREPLDAAAAADAMLVEEDRAKALCHRPSFTFTRRLTGPAPDRPAFAFAGIARPERFFTDLENAGWELTGRRVFADHHHYSVRQIDELQHAAKASGADVIVTTEKDIVRFATTPGIVAIPLEVSIEASFQPWLAERLRAARVGAA